MAENKKGTPAPIIGRTTRSTVAATTTATVRYTYGLNVRENPDTGARVLRVLKDGEQIEVNGNVTAPNGWVAVMGGGFVMEQYLQ